MDSLNPYRDWLRLDTEATSPNYYQLLEVAPADCQEKGQVLAAANRQLAKLKAFQSTDQRELLQQLIDEIKSAARCLANAELRNDYNARLLNETWQKPGTSNNALIKTESRKSPVPANEASTVLDPRDGTSADLEEIPLAIPLSDHVSHKLNLAGERASQKTAEVPSDHNGISVRVESVAKPRRQGPLPLLAVATFLLLAAVAAAVSLKNVWLNPAPIKTAANDSAAQSEANPPCAPWSHRSL